MYSNPYIKQNYQKEELIYLENLFPNWPIPDIFMSEKICIFGKKQTFLKTIRKVTLQGYTGIVTSKLQKRRKIDIKVVFHTPKSDTTPFFGTIKKERHKA